MPDFREMVGAAPADAHAAPRALKRGRAKRPAGLARGVRAARPERQAAAEGGDERGGAAAMVPGRATGLKGKRDAGASSSWVWTSFKNSARKDGLELDHWQRASMEYTDYPYARFNVRLEKVEYSDDEYDRYLQDPNWTKSDTDHLMRLCHKLDLRWPVIADRYAQTPPRPIEQLQQRYYIVAHTLLVVRTGTSSVSDDTIVALGINANSKRFNLEYEEQRRQQLQALFERTRHEELAEVKLRDELKAVEAELRKLKKSAKSAGDGQRASRRGDRIGAPGEPLAADRSSSAQPPPGQPFLQSARFAIPQQSGAGGVAGLNKGLLHKMTLVLAELNMPDRPVPTKRVCDLYDALRRDVVTMLSLQKVLMKKEEQLKEIKQQREMGVAAGAASAARSRGHAPRVRPGEGPAASPRRSRGAWSPRRHRGRAAAAAPQGQGGSQARARSETGRRDVGSASCTAAAATATARRTARHQPGSPARPRPRALGPPPRARDPCSAPP